jgi:prepilin-type N-terminal cleavage/methylation domain-containing protein
MTRPRTALALRLARQEHGVTLVELMVSLGIMAVVITAFLGVFGQAFTSLGRQTTRSNDEDQVRLAVEELDREIRSGNLLYDPSLESGPLGSDVVAGMSLRVYTQTNADTRDPGNRCVQWRITSGELLQRRDWSVNWAVDGQVSGWRIVAENVVNRSLSPQVTAFTLDPDPSKGGRTMIITISVQTDPTKGKAVQIRQSVTGRNTEYGYPNNICDTIPPY